MKLFFCLALAVGVADASFCAVVTGGMPNICKCADETGGGFKITCSIPVSCGYACAHFIDTTLSATYSINPCNMPASMSLEIKNTKPEVSLEKEIAAGEVEHIPIPGAGWSLPFSLGDGAYTLVSLGVLPRPSHSSM